VLTFVVAGTLTLTTRGGHTTSLNPGDLFLVDELSAAHMGISGPAAIADWYRSVVEPDWPGPEAKSSGPRNLDAARAQRRSQDQPNL